MHFLYRIIYVEKGECILTQKFIAEEKTQEIDEILLSPKSGNSVFKLAIKFNMTGKK